MEQSKTLDKSSVNEEMCPYPPHSVQIRDICRSWVPAMEQLHQGSAIPALGLSEFHFFFSLPIEIRNAIYEPFINSAIIRSHPPIFGISSWQTPSFDYAHKLDLHIKPNKVIFRNIRFREIYPLFTANRQIHDEMSAILFSYIRHIKISGDFLLGLAPTQLLFEILEQRPWLQMYVRSVSVELMFCGIHDVCRQQRIDDQIISQHPFLSERLRQMQFVPNTLARSFSLQFNALASRTLETMRRVRGKGTVLGEPTERNTLPTLAKTLQTFSQLEKIDFETEHHQLILLFPSPLATATILSPLLDRGVEINVLLRKWQLRQWRNVFIKHGLGDDELRYRHQNGEEVGFAYETRTGGSMLSYGLVRYRLSDCVKEADA